MTGTGYGIVRFEKIKYSDGGELMGRLKHATRELNGDHLNYDVSKNTLHVFNDDRAGFFNAEKIFANYKKMTADAVRRSSSVGSVEVVFTLSEQEKLFDYNAYYTECIRWAARTFGQKNILCAIIHRDEKVPHCHLFLTPLEKTTRKKKMKKGETEQRTEDILQLNAKKWFGGKDKMRKLQNSFFDNVSKKFGLQRGELAEVTNRKNRRPELNSLIEKNRKTEKQLAAKESEFAERTADFDRQVDLQNTKVKKYNARIKWNEAVMKTVEKELDPYIKADSEAELRSFIKRMFAEIKELRELQKKIQQPLQSLKNDIAEAEKNGVKNLYDYYHPEPRELELGSKYEPKTVKGRGK